MEPRFRRRVFRLVLAVGFVLLVPLVAMLFTDEVDWSLGDFILMGALLFGSGLSYLLIAGMSNSIAYRTGVGIGVGAGLILIWMNLAVGLIGSENNPANLLYVGVLQVGIIGAALARLRPGGMARALYATAFAQALVPVIALIIWQPSLEEPPGMVGVFILNGFFVVLFVVSASLFRQASATAQGAETERV